MTRALVVFESMFGNTETVAREIAAGVASTMDVDVVEVGVAPARLTDDIALVVVGGPTHAFGMSRPSTRQDAAKRAGRAPVSSGIGVREWLGDLPDAGGGVGAAAFDTRANKPRLPGSAARRVHKQLRRLGFRMAARAASFYVTGTSGPLVDGERERARAWGERLGSEVVAAGRAG
jgi:hypothetical protein